MQMRPACGGGPARLAEAVGRGWGVGTSREGLCFGVEAGPRAVELHTEVLAELTGDSVGDREEVSSEAFVGSRGGFARGSVEWTRVLSSGARAPRCPVARCLSR